MIFFVIFCQFCVYSQQVCAVCKEIVSLLSVYWREHNIHWHNEQIGYMAQDTLIKLAEQKHKKNNIGWIRTMIWIN